LYGLFFSFSVFAKLTPAQLVEAQWLAHQFSPLARR
jgi:hypothetical protein